MEYYIDNLAYLCRKNRKSIKTIRGYVVLVFTEICPIYKRYKTTKLAMYENNR